MAVVCNREMGLTHTDFFRILPKALHRYAYTLQNLEVVVVDGGRRLIIRLGPERVRQIGSLRLPKTEISFEFHGYSGEQITAFLGQFDRYYHRGGG